MRRLILPLLLAASPSLFAQEWSDPNIRAQMADGTEIAVPVVTSSDVPVIVEFRDAPLALVRASAAKTAMGDYRATVERFRNDLSAIVNKGVSGKSALAAPPIRREYFEAFNGVALTVRRESVAALRALPYVKRVHLDKPMKASAVAIPVNVSLIKADSVWNLGTRGKGIVVAIIDTGIDYRHPALGGCLGAGCRVIGGYDFYNDDADPMDDHYHGTHVAGIVGGNSDDLVGVAPEVSFLAYKVLNKNGSGSESDVIAAIERAIDPNGDGDLRDHADVANLSLGGYGNADDAASIAIDNATAAGTVFAVAAGNSGSAAHTIDSPGTARLAITVGASDNSDRIASFSSRGPAPKLISIKPDVLAPGVGIRSSMPNGQYGSLSGTSMATPHVAGVVALVRALHPDWTPAQIKMQLMNSGVSIGEDSMVQGAGRIDAMRGATTSTLVDPPSMSLGLDPIGETSWSASSKLRVTNRTDHAVEYAVSTNNVTGVTITTSAPTISLQPGQSADLTVGFTLDNSAVKPIVGSFAIGGTLTLLGSDAADVIRVPWGAVKAARALVNYDRPATSALWIDPAGGTLATAAPISENGDSEILLAPGKYDLMMVSVNTDEQTKVTDARLFYLDNQNLAGDTHIILAAEQAARTITFDARNENGQPLAGSDLTGYAVAGRILLPASSKIKSLSLPPVGSRTWHTGDISSSLTLVMHELYYDAKGAKMYIVPQRPLAGVNGNATLTAGGNTLRRADVSLLSAQSLFGDRRVLIGAQAFVPGGNSSLALTVPNTTYGSYVFGNTLFLGPDTLEGYSFGATYTSIVDGVTNFISPTLRIVNDRLVAASSTSQVSSWAWNGPNFAFGLGLVYPSQSFAQTTLPLHPVIFTDWAGELGESRTSDRLLISTTQTRSADGVVISSGARYPLNLDVSVPGAYRIEASSSVMSLYPTVPRQAKVTMNLNSSRADYFPPVFTGAMLFDGAGKFATRLEPNGGGSLQFAAADYSYAGLAGSVIRTYSPVKSEATKAWYRASGAADWLPLTVTQVMEDTSSTLSQGILFRADLSPLTNISDPRRLYDIKLDVEDASGNTTSYQLTPAFSVGPETPGRRRAAR